MSFAKFDIGQSTPSKYNPCDKSEVAPVAAQPEETPAEEMAKYGITRVPVDYFHYGDFRYTNLKDAVAQAKRPVHG